MVIVRNKLFRISCVEIGHQKLTKVVEADHLEHALNLAKQEWPGTDTRPFRTDWDAKFLGVRSQVERMDTQRLLEVMNG